MNEFLEIYMAVNMGLKDKHMAANYELRWISVEVLCFVYLCFICLFVFGRISLSLTHISHLLAMMAIPASPSSYARVLSTQECISCSHKCLFFFCYNLFIFGVNPSIHPFMDGWMDGKLFCLHLLSSPLSL